MADRSDDPGVLGNLPRSRPGTRSAKRASGATARKQPAAGGTSKRASTAARSAAAKSKASGSRAAARPRKPPATSSPPPRQQPPQQTDPVTQAVRLAGKVAETGVKTAVGILKRLPGGR